MEIFPHKDHDSGKLSSDIINTDQFRRFSGPFEVTTSYGEANPCNGNNSIPVDKYCNVQKGYMVRFGKSENGSSTVLINCLQPFKEERWAHKTGTLLMFPHK
ncbi:hypothetical protein HUJ04_010542 [Dendroctonus ponderosae]|nr:hypothetical protein HUJ04_010542 [Dendroctonus ponderosae]